MYKIIMCTNTLLKSNIDNVEGAPYAAYVEGTPYAAYVGGAL